MAKIDINEKPKSHPSVMWDNSSIAELPSDSLLEEGELDVYKKLSEVIKLNVYNLEILEEDDDIMLVDLWLLHAGKNRNGCDISKEVIEEAIPYFYNKFIVYQFDNEWLPSDVKEHNNDLENTAMHIAGTILPQGGYRWITKNNKDYLVMVGAISKVYQPTLVNIIKKRKGNMGVSIEIKFPKEDADKAEQDAKDNIGDGYIHISKMRPRGVALLGKGIVEGIEGSEMNVTKFAFDINKIDDYNERFLNFVQKKEKNHNILLQIKKNAQNIKEGIFEGKEERELKNSVLIKNELGNYELSEKIYNELRPYKYHDGEWEGSKYWIKEIYPDSHYVVVEDNETAKFYKIDYRIDENGSVHLDMDSKKEVVESRTWKEKDVESKFFTFTFAKKDFGTSGAIEVDKSKEAVSDTLWGDVDKTALRNKVLEASNYKTLVKDVYAQVEDSWEDAPSENLKYPIMEIKNGKAVYNRYGLASALGYAKAEKDEEVISKVEALYKKLDLDDKEDEDMDKIKNKLDKDNPELKKIRDDAEADEDDEKEKLAKNSIDKVEDDKLKDDVDADKDYWKSKYTELECALKAKEEELEKYRLAEDKVEMKKVLKSYRKCFTKEELDKYACDIETMSKEDFIKSVEKKALEFAKSEDEADDIDDDEIDEEERRGSETEEVFKNSFGLPTNPFVFYGSNKDNTPKNIDDVLKILGK